MSFFDNWSVTSFEEQAEKDGEDLEDGFKPLPEGVYDVEIDRAEEKPTKSAGGLGLSLGLKVSEGSYKGRMLFDWINLKNNNPTAELIGQKQLRKLFKALGVDAITPPQMVGRKLSVRTKIGKNVQGDPDTKIKGYLAPGGAAQEQAKASKPAWVK